MINLSDYGIELHIVRHGEYKPTKVGGWTDDKLSDTGIKQINKLLDQIDSQYDLFISSDLNRAKDSALILNQKLNMDITFDLNFREFDMGILNTMSIEDYQKNAAKLNIQITSMDDKFPEGESANMFFNRVKKGFIEVLENNRNKKILMVTHSGVINIILCLINDYEFSFGADFAPATGTMIKLK